MISQRFVATENAFEKGIDQTTPAQGAKLAGEWAAEVRKADFAGAKGLADELERLEKLLKEDEPDGEKVWALFDTIGEHTRKAADKADDDKIGQKVTGLADAMASKTTA